MKYFNEIYQAAQMRDSETLKKLFKKGACIDTRWQDVFLNTPAGVLAEEGDIESAKYLVEFHGANPAFIAFGLMKAPNNKQEEANQWIEQYGMDKERIFSAQIDYMNKKIYTRAFVSHCEPDTSTTHRPFHEAKAITGEIDKHDFKKLHHKSFYLDAIAYGGHLYLAETIFRNSFSKPMPSLYSLFSSSSYSSSNGIPVFRLQTEKLALHAFSFIQDDRFLAAILRKIADGEGIFEPFQYDVEAVMNQARKIRTIMQTDGVGYSEALAVCDQRDIQLPPILETSLPFFKHTTYVKTEPNSNKTIVQENYSVSVLPG